MSPTAPRPTIDEIARAAQWNGQIRQARDWRTVEQDIGTVLPDDYKNLLNRFPSGAYRTILVVTNPIDARTDYTGFIRDEIQGILEILGDDELEYLENADYPIFPEPGGLLPWGHDGQGGMLCWVTKPANPNQWPVAYYSRGLSAWTEHPGPMTKVIMEILTSVDEENIFQIRLDSQEPKFRVPSMLLANGEWMPDSRYV